MATARAWTPQAGPQTEAYLTEAFETLYGGQAGGGKSDFLLGLARMEYDRALILRRTFPDVERSLAERSKEFYGDPNLYNASKHVWSLPGQRIEFGYLESAKDLANYQGVRYRLIGFDEVTQHPRMHYQSMFRAAGAAADGPAKGVRVRVVATANPGGEGHVWVKERWSPWLDDDHPNPARAGELRWFATVDGSDMEVGGPEPFMHKGELIIPLSRTFIPARLEDNRYLGPDYKARLQALPEPMRSQLLHGDWRAGLEADAYQVIARSWVKQAMDRWKAIVTPHGTVEKAIEAGAFGELVGVGLDVAEGLGAGADDTVLAIRFKKGVALLVRRHGFEPMESVGLVEEELRRWAKGRRVPLVVDATGLGSGVAGRLRELGHDVIPFIAGDPTDFEDREGNLEFGNCRAGMAWNLREVLDPERGDSTALPPEELLMGDVCAARYKPLRQIILRPKEEIRALLGRSPDAGDAVEMAYWLDQEYAQVGISYV